MKISRNLNLVVPIETEKHGKIYVHSVSISRDIFEQFYLELGKVFTQCFDGNNELHLVMSAPQLAYPALKSLAKKMGTWEGAGGVQSGLVNEIVRLTHAVVDKGNGWETLPFDILIKHQMVNEDEEAEVLSALVFFTAISRVAAKDLRESFLAMAGSLRNWQLLSLDCTEFKNSLVILTKEESIGEKVKVSSIVC